MKLRFWICGGGSVSSPVFPALTVQPMPSWIPHCADAKCRCVGPVLWKCCIGFSCTIWKMKDAKRNTFLHFAIGHVIMFFRESKASLKSKRRKERKWRNALWSWKKQQKRAMWDQTLFLPHSHHNVTVAGLDSGILNSELTHSPWKQGLLIGNNEKQTVKWKLFSAD